TPNLPAMQTIYHVFEAMEFGKSAPHVGRRLRLLVATSDGFRSITQSGVDCLIGYHKQLGLKPTHSLSNSDFKAEYFEPVLSRRKEKDAVTSSSTSEQEPPS